MFNFSSFDCSTTAGNGRMPVFFLAFVRSISARYIRSVKLRSWYVKRWSLSIVLPAHRTNARRFHQGKSRSHNRNNQNGVDDDCPAYLVGRKGQECKHQQSECPEYIYGIFPYRHTYIGNHFSEMRTFQTRKP